MSEEQINGHGSKLKFVVIGVGLLVVVAGGLITWRMLFGGSDDEALPPAPPMPELSSVASRAL